MAESTLGSDSGDSEGLEFYQLREDAIGMLQRLCGAHWTDYNLHDPGVTVMEQLVYGITDLAYRTGFDMADYLTSPDGTIAWNALALYRPEAIFSSEAVTINDYRRLIYDALPEVSDVWIWHCGGGLLSIDVMRDPDATATRAVPLDQSVRLVYAAHRTLCEDLAQVRLVTPRRYYLSGLIETHGERERAEILAQIYFDCGDYLSSGMQVQRLTEAAADGRTLDELFDGPAMAHGHVTARGWADRVRIVNVSELVGQIQKIEGVSRVRELVLKDASHQPVSSLVCDSREGSYPILPFPDPDMAERLVLQPTQGTEYGVLDQMLPVGGENGLYQEALLELHKLRFERHAFRTESSRSHECYSLPTGRYRDLRAYYTIQDEFPEVYGINRYGLPHDVSEERKTQARQLKAFLFPCEQLMANYLQNLQDVPALLSPQAGGPQPTYMAQYLGNDKIARIEELYTPDAAHIPAALEAAMRKHDDQGERKGRVYDYLLALYGETFPQTALRRFNQYHANDTEAWLLDAKRRLLAALEELSGARARGFNYFKQSGTVSNTSPLQRRLAILLGFDSRSRESRLSPTWEGKALALDGGTAAASAADEQWRTIPPLAKDEVPPAPQLPLAPETISAELFRHGAVLANYRMHTQDAQTVLFCGAGAHWEWIGNHPTNNDAIKAAHAAALALLDLNQRAEGMHLVEHILLRPWDGPPEGQSGEGAFYQSRMSVILPAYTLRGASSAFRNFVEETVRVHCPAHIHAEFLWLPQSSMSRFEDLLGTWHDELREYHLRGAQGRGDSAESVREAAAGVERFLLAHEDDA